MKFFASRLNRTTLFGMLAGLVFCAMMVAIVLADGYATVPVATVPAYAAGYAAQLPAPAEDDRLKRLEDEVRALRAEVAKVVRLLEEAAGDRPPAAGAERPETPLAFRQLNRAEEQSVVSKLQRNRMPPPDSGVRLTAEERAELVAVYGGQKKPGELFAAAGSRCAGCHSPAAAAQKGDGFVLFSPK